MSQSEGVYTMATYTVPGSFHFFPFVRKTENHLSNQLVN